ncbi:PLDc N-terminal domain-containing protein [Boudabousia marimammalium]|uniref:Cardiolipin synthase N-terminal domain-containing protein n=1 Tax=Boudabousia marimammalium TaxID=156892 RepID=A0A1Q5PMJ8_9ACTO|nr:PLDc N-terminal domain-containing protein [Boudabousia marimammalium]OKL48705.1 hypothetical protein BM477_05785 [Boudabousia marimammalium]
MARILLYVVPILLALYALIECALTDGEEMPYRIPKPFWFAIILLLTVIGPLAWIVLLRIERAERGEKAPSPRDVLGKVENMARGQQSEPEPEAGPHSPDDDEEYLERIQREVNRQKLAKQRAAEKEAERKALLEEQKRQQQAKSSPEQPENDSNQDGGEAEDSTKNQAEEDPQENSPEAEN